MSEIEKVSGRRLPISALFRNSTVRSLSELLDQGMEYEKWKSLVTIRKGGRKNPLFIVHGAGLNVLLFNSLVSHMDPEQPIFGLQAKGLDGKGKPLKSIPEIAAYYISEISAVKPDGPYNIAGYSFGGYVAFEMAKQLRKAGRKVSFLGLFDTIAYMDNHLKPLDRCFGRICRIPRKITYIIRSYTSMSSGQRKKFWEWKIKAWKLRFRRMPTTKYIGDEICVEDGAMSIPFFLQEVYNANYLAQNRYLLEPCDVEIVLFKARDQSFFIDDLETYGWANFARGGICTHSIPGEHAAIFAAPNDKIFGDLLQKAIDARNPQEAI